MPIKCKICGTDFEPKVTKRVHGKHAYRNMDFIFIVVSVIVGIGFALSFLTGSGWTPITLIEGYMLTFAALISVAFYILARDENMRNTCCESCINKKKSWIRQKGSLGNELTAL